MDADLDAKMAIQSLNATLASLTDKSIVGALPGQVAKLLRDSGAAHAGSADGSSGGGAPKGSIVKQELVLVTNRDGVKSLIMVPSSNPYRARLCQYLKANPLVQADMQLRVYGNVMHWNTGDGTDEKKSSAVSKVVQCADNCIPASAAVTSSLDFGFSE